MEHLKTIFAFWLLSAAVLVVFGVLASRFIK